MVNLKAKGFVLFIAGAILFSLPASARRARPGETPRAGIFSSVYHDVKGIGYEAEIAESITGSLEGLFPSLGSLEDIADQRERIVALSELIRSKISYGDDMFDLSEIIKTGQANCFGYVQLVYVLGKAINLDVGGIPVYFYSTDYQYHAANIIKLNESEYIILDLSMDGDAYISSAFNLDEHYIQIDGVWFQNEGSSLGTKYKIIQIEFFYPAIKSMLYNNLGAYHALSGSHQEALEYYDKAIALNPNNGMVFHNRGLFYAGMGQHLLAIVDYNRAVELNPFDYGVFYHRGMAKHRLGRISEALQDIIMVEKIESLLCFPPPL